MTDQDVAHAVKAALQKSGFTCLQKADCTVVQGVVELHGQVHSFYIKQMGQETVRRISGVTQVVNQLEVSDW